MLNDLHGRNRCFRRRPLRAVTVALSVVLHLIGADAVMAQQQQRSKWDTELAAYPVEAAACAALAKGGTGSLVYDPFTTPGLLPKPGAQITGSIVPRTPVYLFWADHQRTFFSDEIAFSPSMKCALNTGLNAKGIFEFTHVPDGDYLIFIFDTYMEAWSGVSTSTGYGHDMFGGPVTTETKTPVSGQTRHTRIFGQKFDIRDGKVSSTAPPLELW